MGVSSGRMMGGRAMSEPKGHRPLPILKDAQARASDPGGHVWLSASAGTGKTQVLTARVYRLLLRGVDPAAILCLTFTKAGAAEMAGRIGERLAAWVRMAEPDLARRSPCARRRPVAPSSSSVRGRCSRACSIRPAAGSGSRRSTVSARACCRASRSRRGSSPASARSRRARKRSSREMRSRKCSSPPRPRGARNRSPPSAR